MVWVIARAFLPPIENLSHLFTFLKKADECHKNKKEKKVSLSFSLTLKHTALFWRRCYNVNTTPCAYLDFCCCSCQMYYHGESIAVNVHISNRSNKTVKKIKMAGNGILSVFQHELKEVEFRMWYLLELPTVYIFKHLGAGKWLIWDIIPQSSMDLKGNFQGPELYKHQLWMLSILNIWH